MDKTKKDILRAIRGSRRHIWTFFYLLRRPYDNKPPYPSEWEYLAKQYRHYYKIVKMYKSHIKWLKVSKRVVMW